MSEASGTLLWFRHDLRLTDNPALLAAVSRGGPVIPVFIWSPEEEGRWQPGSAVRWWLHQSLGRLDASLHQHHSRLIIRRGPTLETMRELLDQSGATAVYWNRQYEPALISRDSSLKAALHKDGLIAESFNGSVLFEPWTVRKQNGQPYQVFSAFWKACLGQPEPAPPQNAPSHVATPRHWPSTLKLADLCLEPTVDWTGGLRTTWCPGEAGAAEQLRCFEEQALAGYATARDQPDRPGTSRLSPHLHFGEISVRQIWFAVRKHRRGSGLTRYAQKQSAFMPANSAGGNSPTICCSTFRTRRNSPCARSLPIFLGNGIEKTYVRGSAAARAIPSSTPACASCGTPVGCTTACAWWWHRSWSKTC